MGRVPLTNQIQAFYDCVFLPFPAIVLNISTKATGKSGKGSQDDKGFKSLVTWHSQSRSRAMKTSCLGSLSRLLVQSRIPPGDGASHSGWVFPPPFNQLLHPCIPKAFLPCDSRFCQVNKESHPFQWQYFCI